MTTSTAVGVGTGVTVDTVVTTGATDEGRYRSLLLTVGGRAFARPHQSVRREA
ncbi:MULTISPECIES: hypothetical protein [Streptomyces]|uniref:Uncharacterized protein n=1 Tax=Streptomyces bugieae TaxID=3098223 RepID=A0ABU7NJX5_9ACTN|nr:hypothetical protein [Streptomyces nigrescens]MEE4419162.1 hypothetical protein [Streptomyces sp. DSM 41528]